MDMMGMFEQWLRLRSDDRRRENQTPLTDFGSSPLHKWAQTQELKKMKKYLQERPSDVDIRDSDSGVTPLMSACSIGDLNAVEFLTDHGANIHYNCCGINGIGLKYSNVTPIYVAAEQGHKDVVKYLGKKGVDVNQKCSPAGFTPLHRAVTEGFEDVVSVLVKEFQADVNAPTPGGLYPLMTAVQLQEYGILKLLLGSDNVNPSPPDTVEGITPLHYAAYSGDKTSVLLLIDKNADVNAEIFGGFTPLDLAVQERRNEVSAILRQHGGRKNVRNQNWQPFFKCVLSGLGSLKTSINRGVAIDSRLSHGGTALHLAAKRGIIDCCKYLLRKGAHVNYEDDLGNTPLHKAAVNAMIQIGELLLEKGANVNAQNKVYSTPLHIASKQGHYSMVKWLISKGADITIQEYEGGSPFFSAVASGHSKIVDLFLNSGADPNSSARIDSIDSVSALHLACLHASNKPKVIKALVNAGADVNEYLISTSRALSPLHLLTRSGPSHIESFRILIEGGSFIDAKMKAVGPCCEGGHNPLNPISASILDVLTKSGEGPQLISNTLNLFKAVRQNDLSLAKKWLENGGLVNCCSIKFETPLTYASWKGNTSMVKFLLSAGASVQNECIKMSTPLHYAVKYNHKSIVIQLLKAGSKYDAVCCNKTPLDLAEEKNHHEIASLLKFVDRWYATSGKTHICPATDLLTDQSFLNMLEQVDDEALQKDLKCLFGGGV